MIIRRYLALVAGLWTLSCPSSLLLSADLRFTQAQIVDNLFIMEVDGVPSEGPCSIESAPTLTGDWVHVAVPDPPGNGLISVPIDYPQQFFRVRCDNLLSINSTGYVQIQKTASGTYVTNPFDTGSNLLAEVLGSNHPVGTTLYQYDAATQTFYATLFGADSWTDLNQTLPPGKGTFFKDALPSPLVLGGLVNSPGAVPPLVPGWNLIGLAAATQSVPAGEESDAIYLLRNNGYVKYLFELGTWTPKAPKPQLGEGFWYFRNQPGATPPVGGCVLLNNTEVALGAPGGAPMFFFGCRVEGSNYLAQLFLRDDPISQLPLGTPVVPLGGRGLGFYNTGTNAVRYVNPVAPGEVATFEIKNWLAEDGASAEEALAKGGMVLQSLPLSITTGGAGAPPSLPASLVGLTSFDNLASIASAWIVGDKVVVAGSTAQLTVEYLYHGPSEVQPAVQWHKITSDWSTRVPLEEATNLVLELREVSPRDQGYYWPLLTFGDCDTVSSAVFELLVAPARSFTFSTTVNWFGEVAIELGFGGEPDQEYVLESSANLVDWSQLQTTSGTALISQPLPSAPDHEFYRARLLPP